MKIKKQPKKYYDYDSFYKDEIKALAKEIDLGSDLLTYEIEAFDNSSANHRSQDTRRLFRAIRAQIANVDTAMSQVRKHQRYHDERKKKERRSI